MDKTIVHYIYDPLCGWCYAASPIVSVMQSRGVDIELHGGALWEPATKLDNEKASFIRNADERIAQLSGVTFGHAYLEGLLKNPDTVFWSRPTVAAVMAASNIEPKLGINMLSAIQHAHYVLGLRVVNQSELISLANELGISESKFKQALNGLPLDDHIHKTRALMQKFGVSGFPAFIRQSGPEFSVIQHQRYYSNPEGVLQEL